MDREKQSIELCRKLIERSLGWGDSAEWNKQDFENLSEKIFEKTQVRLSVSTLKRIWGKVRYDNTPTHATLNVLARFLGFETWREFQHENSSDEEAQQPKPDNIKSNRGRRTVRIFSISAVFVAGVVLTLLVAKAPDNGIFKARKVSDDLPNSVVFTYDASGFDADSVFIQQSWDPNRRERVSPTGKQHTSVYYTPGYFIAKLIVNNEIKKEDIVFIKTKGWKGIIDTKPPIYVSESEMKQPGGMGITSALMHQKTGESVFNHRSITFSNVTEFGLSGTAFTLETKLRNTATVEECLCRKVIITILSKGGAIVIPFSAKGCIAELNLLAPDGWVSGKDNDLSAFGCDFIDFEHIICQVENNHLKVSLNGTQIFDQRQESSVEEIIGVRIAFEGVGVIKELRLSGPEKAVYEEVFSPQ